MPKARFERGRSVFKCATCGRSTRITTQPSGSELCEECDELAMMENSILDKCQTVAEIARFRDELIAECVKKGGDKADIEDNFATLFG